MLIAFKCEVGVNFVGNDNYIVVGANFGHAYKLFATPHTSAGVVRMAQEEELALFYFLLKILKIKFILSIN